MTRYWDSSALIASLSDSSIADRLQTERGITLSHSFCEVFSTLTGGRMGFRVDAEKAARMIRELADVVESVALETAEILDALDLAKSKGVRGGRVYDYMHATAAQRFTCTAIYTLNPTDFDGLCGDLEILPP